MCRRTRGSPRALPTASAKRREASTTARSISTTSTVSAACRATAAAVVPLPSPLTSTWRAPPGPRPAIGDEQPGGEGQVDRDPDLDRPLDPQGGHEQEPGADGADDRPQRVDGVQVAHVGARPVCARGDGDRTRKCCPDQQG